MEELKNAFYEVMYKYRESFGERGVMKNLNAWAAAKDKLLALLRFHPNWDEAAKAVVIEFSEDVGLTRTSLTKLLYLIDREGNVYIYLAELKAAMESEHSYVCDEEGEPIVFSPFDARRLPVLSMETALEQLSMDLG